MKSVNSIIESGETLFIAQNRGELTRFGLFDYRTNTLLYVREILSALANSWSYCSKAEAIAALSFEKKTVSVFRSLDGSDLSTARESVGAGASLLIYDKQIRITLKTLTVLNLEGRVLMRTPIPGVFQFDIGIYFVSSVNWKYHFHTKLGELVFTLPRLKSNLVLCVHHGQRLAVAEVGGPIQILDLKGKPLFKIGVPSGFDAASVHFTDDGVIMACHCSQNVGVTTFPYAITVYDLNGKFVCEERSSYWPGKFSNILPGWISGNLITMTYRNRTFHSEVIDVIQEGFDIMESSD